MKLSFPKLNRSRIGFSLPETMVAVLIAGIMFTALHACFASGFAAVKATRERLRATQVILHRMEGIRLCGFDQITNTVINPRSFTEYFDNAGGTGIVYDVRFTPSVPAAGTLPDAYRTNMLLIT